jgi:hypothetical protein
LQLQHYLPAGNAKRNTVYEPDKAGKPTASATI